MFDVHHAGQCKPQTFADMPKVQLCWPCWCSGVYWCLHTCALLLSPHSSAQRWLPLGSPEDAQGCAWRCLPCICSSWGSGGHQGKHPQLQWRRGWGARWSKIHCHVTIKRQLMLHHAKENAFCALSSAFVLQIQPCNWQMNYLEGSIYEGACFLSREFLICLRASDPECMLKGACRVSLAVGNKQLLDLVSGNIEVLRAHLWWSSKGLEDSGVLVPNGQAFPESAPNSRCSHLPCWEGEVLNRLLWVPGTCGGCGRTFLHFCV